MRFLLALIILLYSCGNNQPIARDMTNEPALKLLHSPAVDYPSVRYDEVALYTVDARHYRDEHLVPARKMKQSDDIGVGFAILDSLGNPAFQNIDRTLLAPAEMIQLRSIFHIPENLGQTQKIMCIPSFRDAFVFYRNKKQVAQTQICFECRQVYFPKDTSNLEERFTTDGNWDELQILITKIKGHQNAANTGFTQVGQTH